jgi:hypothetical protein
LLGLPVVSRSPDGWTKCRCPAHKDDNASFSFKIDDDGTVHVKCHAGCTTAAILRALGDFDKRHLFPQGQSGKRIVATYDYSDRDGQLLHQVVRYDPKDFRQRRPDSKGGWIWNLKGVPIVPYRLKELLDAPPEVEVYVVEGEKDADNLRAIGLTATTNAGGAGKWRKEHSEVLRGRKVVVLPDNDEPGLKHAQLVAASLQGIAASVKVVLLPGLPPKGDVSDWLAMTGNDRAALEALVAVALQCDAKATSDSRPEQEPPRAKPQHTEEPPSEAAPSVDGDSPPWPSPLAEPAFHGLAGEIVRAIEPHTEADPVALLVQLLIGFGVALGRSANFRAESDTHYLNEFGLLVGTTSKGRKGTSWAHDRNFLEKADPQFVKDRVLSRMSSGEGLIWQCRDPIYKQQPIKEKSGRVVDYQDVQEDPGVKDKRLLALEPEFASALRRMEGQTGNTLSAILRQAWETGDLRTLTKNSPANATGAHIGIVAHSTADELRRYLSATETANGFGNRFNYFCVRRSKVLPEGGALDAAVVDALGKRLAEALAFGRKLRELRRDDEARATWAAVYPQLSEGQPGLSGCLLARAEAHVMRFAALYAVLDKSAVIRKEHLLASLALWEYVEESVRYIFGDSTGDPLADDLLRLLRSAGKAGMTRTEIGNYLGRHQSGNRISQALEILLQAKRAKFEREETGGRPSERWKAA